MTRLTFENLWTNGRWHSDITLELIGSATCTPSDGTDAGDVLVGQPAKRQAVANPPEDRSEYIRGLTLPGLASAHCHAFQRILPAWTQRAASVDDSFWTWRNVMYTAAECLDREGLEAIAARCYLDLLRGGYTAVAEFLYLHRLAVKSTDAPDADLAIASAARRVGIGLTLLPALYQYSDFGRAPATRAQMPFVRSTPRFIEDWRELKRRYADEDSSIGLGIAFHSLRAVDIDTIGALCADIASDEACRAIHIHVSEQQAEVAACLRHWSCTPIELLLGRGLVDGRWTLVHGTHATRAELEGICGRDATLAVCPTTEADLGDGCPDVAAFLLGGGYLAIGSDSNVCCNAFAELRLLEWSQRLRHQRRNVLASTAESSVADRLYGAALVGGWNSLGKRERKSSDVLGADFVTFDDSAGNWRDQPPENWLSALVFGCGEPMARHVMVGGRWLIRDGVHANEAEIELACRAALSRLRPKLMSARSIPTNGDHSC